MREDSGVDTNKHLHYPSGFASLLSIVMVFFGVRGKQRKGFEWVSNYLGKKKNNGYRVTVAWEPRSVAYLVIMHRPRLLAAATQAIRPVLRLLRGALMLPLLSSDRRMRFPECGGPG